MSGRRLEGVWKVFVGGWWEGVSGSSQSLGGRLRLFPELGQTSQAHFTSQALPRAWVDSSGSSQSSGGRLRLFPELGLTSQALPRARADVSGSSQIFKPHNLM